MSLFDVIPHNFFSILSSKNKEIYVDALMRLHQLFQYELNIALSDFISELISVLEDRNYELEEDEAANESDMPLREKARLILDRLVAAGWIDREYLDGSFTEVITPKDYAIVVMKLLSELGETKVREYNSLVFSTYSALNQAWESQPEQMYEAMILAKTNTERLLYELKTLYHGIRGYLRQIYGQHSINALLSAHFDDYKELADRVYHPIKTMDTVPRYKEPIRKILLDVLDTPAMMETMCRRAMAVRGYKETEEARGEVISSANYVLDAYQSIDAIIAEIDRKHRTYTNLSISTIRYHMTADQIIAGKLAALLRVYGEADDAGKKTVVSLLEQGVHVNRQEFIDEASPWRRNAKSRRVASEPLTIQPDSQLSEEEVGRILRTLDDGYSLQKVAAYMKRLLNDRERTSTEEIALRDDADFILLLLSAVRAGERDIGFTAEIGETYREINGYRVPELTFIKKGADKHVE